MIALDQGGGHCGSVRVIKPPADLLTVVEFAWVDVRRDPPTSSERAWRVVPDESAHLIFKVPGDPKTGASDPDRVAMSLVGPRRIHKDIDTTGRVATVGVRLRTGVLHRVLRDSASTLVDQGRPLSELSSEGIRSIETVQAAVGHCAREELTQGMLVEAWRFLRSHVGDVSSIDGRIHQALNMSKPSECRLDHKRIAQEIGTSERTLRSIMKDQVGIGLKLTTRIRRMHRVLSLALVSGDRSWARFASAAGYYDQSHLINESRALVGDTPEGFLSRSGGSRTSRGRNVGNEFSGSSR